MDDADFHDEYEHDDAQAEQEAAAKEDEFTALEKEYIRLLGEMEENPELAHYADTFTELFETLYTSREKVVQLVEVKDKMEKEAHDRRKLLHRTNKQIRADRLLIKELRREVHNSHKLIDKSHQREQGMQEIIDNFRKQVQSLQGEIDIKNKIKEADTEKTPGVTKFRTSTERENELLKEEVSKLYAKLENACDYQDQLEVCTSQAHTRMGDICDAIDEANNKLQICKNAKEATERELEFQSKELTRKQDEIEYLRGIIQNDETQLIGYDKLKRKHVHIVDNCYKQVYPLNLKIYHLKTDCRNLSVTLKKLKERKEEAFKMLRSQKQVSAQMRVNIVQMKRQVAHATHKMARLERERDALLNEKQKTQKEIRMMDRVLETHRHQAAVFRLEVKRVERECAVLKHSLALLRQRDKKSQSIIEDYAISIKKLNNQLDTMAQERVKRNAQIFAVIKERDDLQEEVSQKEGDLEDIQYDLRDQRREIRSLRHAITATDSKIVTQKQSYNELHLRKQFFERQMHNAVDSNSFLKTYLQTQIKQNEQLKLEIAEKNQHIINKERMVKEVIQQQDNMMVALNNSAKLRKEVKEKAHELRIKDKLMRKSTVDYNQVIRKQKETIANLLSDRAVLALEIDKRNEELALLYQKLAILRTTLQNGDTQYKQRLEDIRLLKLEIKRLRQEKMLFEKSINSVIDLKQEVFQLERELTRERLKNKALEDEFHKPLNIHRWRKLEGTDPDAFALIQKLNRLQKRFVKQSKHLYIRETQLKEAEKMYNNLRRFAAKRPSPEIYEQMKQKHEAIIASTKQMKCLVSELSMVELKNQECNMYLTQKRQELHEVKTKLLVERRKRAKNDEALRAIRATNQSESLPAIKFVGGGFRMSVSVRAINL